jgi:predicted alpha/beta-fold hydrolase
MLSFSELMRTTCEFNPPPFAPHPFLRTGHLQTFATALLARRNLLPPFEERLITVESGTQVRCDCNWQARREGTITAVIVHGMGGSSTSPIVVTMANKLWTRGMNVVRYNMRNCGGTEQYAPHSLYHSGMHGDVMAVIEHLIADGCEAVVLVGFSAGGNLALNTAGMYGDRPPRQLRAVAGISAPMEVAASADALHEWANRLYEWVFLRELVELFRTKCRMFPQVFDITDLEDFRSIRHFDDVITAPYSGYSRADTLYPAISSSRVADKITVPTLVLHANDDPFIRLLPQTRAKLAANPNVCLVETQRGGHCGFISRARGEMKWWADEAVLRFFEFILCGDVVLKDR